ncbi:MAG TPA: cytochrome C [Bacteroidota bacterium]|nr:cytochrome C [Bacteroidota bacterium]
MTTLRTIGLLLCLCALRSAAQISPGELSAAHAQFEGVENCTLCHSIGKSIADDQCLACHGEIKTRIAQKKGYHASIGGKHCFDCHKEHHGRQFELVRFDRKGFNHASTGFALEGKHANVECAKCHEPSKIRAKDIQSFDDKRKRKTLLGLTTDCLSCHKDQHQGQLSAQCASCHTFEQWKPASKFTHARSKFPLTGKHEQVECQRCHKNKLRDGVTVQFVRMEFASCKSCHADAHKGKFQQPCSQCHTTEGFHQIKGSKFDHSVTQFPLVGKHASVKCAECHAAVPTAKNVSGEIGFHITKYKQCANCHADAHAHQFDNRADKGKCEACHTVDGFTTVHYSAADHDRTAFPLTGSHRAIPCVKCHEQGNVRAKSTWQFHWDAKLVCTLCHADVHKGQFASQMKNGCETCHSTESWQTLAFSHDRTKFPLRGRHETLACAKCHKKSEGPDAAVQFAGTVTGCADCHADEHERQFAVDGQTKCEKCHTAKGWKALIFDHNTQSRFALTGGHAGVRCEKCHKAFAAGQRRPIRYKPMGVTCAECHQSK